MYILTPCVSDLDCRLLLIVYGCCTSSFKFFVGKKRVLLMHALPWDCKILWSVFFLPTSAKAACCRLQNWWCSTFLTCLLAGSSVSITSTALDVKLTALLSKYIKSSICTYWSQRPHQRVPFCLTSKWFTLIGTWKGSDWSSGFYRAFGARNHIIRRPASPVSPVFGQTRLHKNEHEISNIKNPKPHSTTTTTLPQ